MNKLKIWLRDWNKNHLNRVGKAAPKPAPWGAANDNGAWAKAALLSGPPGVGKTTTAYLVAQVGRIGGKFVNWHFMSINR